MKNFSLLIFLMTTIASAVAQSPQAFNYQALFRTDDGAPISGRELMIRVAILTDTTLNTVVYSELHHTSTDPFGRVNLQIGHGENLQGIFQNINWGGEEFFIKIEFDDEMEGNFQFAGQAQLLSVPFALYANNSANNLVAGEGIHISGDTITNTGDLSNTNELQALSISNDTIFLTDGGFVVLPPATNAIVPPGGCINSLNPVPPNGYVYSGTSFSAGDQWDAMPAMSYARFAPAVVAVGNKIYVMGGWDGVGAVSNIVEVFDIETNTWERRANMHTATVYAAAVAVGNAIHVMGGYNGITYLNRHQVYNTITNTWSLAANLPQSRSGSKAALVSGQIFLVGGFNGSALNTNQAYDPFTNAWTEKAAMPTARTDFALASFEGGFYAIGGWDQLVLNTNEFYNAATNAWFTHYPSITYRSASSASVVNNKVYLIGGGDEYSYQTLTEEYDPLTNSWKTKSYLPSPRSYFGTAVVDDKIYLVGGNFGQALKTMLVYNPQTQQIYIHCSE